MSERPAYYLFEPPPGTSWRNTRSDRRSVRIEDARAGARAVARARGLARESIEVRTLAFFAPE